MISGNLTFQCTRNGLQNFPYCPGSIQDTFIIYSSISHQHISQIDFAKAKLSRKNIRKSANPKTRFTKRSQAMGNSGIHGSQGSHGNHGSAVPLGNIGSNGVQWGPMGPWVPWIFHGFSMNYRGGRRPTKNVGGCGGGREPPPRVL